MPHFKIESSLKGLVAGVDEVGRGPLAGPVLACALVFPTPPKQALASAIRDSKKLTEKARESLFAEIKVSGAVFALAAASVPEIARLNILWAAMLAMQRAVARLRLRPDHVLVDGHIAPAFHCPARCVIGGDDISLSIAAASIVAKVVRDRGMARLDRRWPGYGWATNAGYSTRFHLEALAAKGPTPHHRMSFAPLLKPLD